jgi:hypothetical protein
MRSPKLAAVALLLILVGCSGPVTEVADDPAPGSTLFTSSTSQVTTSTHTSRWLTVRYRSNPVDVAHPRFEHLDGAASSLVESAFYDSANQYLIVSLNGTAYHYCGMPDTVWSEFATAGSLGSFYNARIKGRFSCQAGLVPDYP